MKRELAALALVLIILGQAISLKFARYGDEGDASMSAAVGYVVQLMQMHGWKPQGGLYIAGGVYEQLRFRRPGCDNSVFVAFLRGNAEASEFFRQDHGGDVMFVQGGDVVERPGGLGRMGKYLLQQVAETLGFERTPPMPVLAIAPSAGAFASDCQGPSMAAWQDKASAKTFR
ncbi:MAG TPA: hypothetical protein PKD49_00545 [Hyphomicrobium sp.]|nr:hypothetical protein [Hyphomicrobium sp.]